MKTIWNKLRLLLAVLVIVTVMSSIVSILQFYESSRAMLVDQKWPLYPNFDPEDVNENTSLPDPLLLHKIISDINYFRPPIFRKNGTKTSHKISRIIHQSWKSETIPSQAEPWISKWKLLLPDWTYIFWTDQKAESFIRTHYPSLWLSYNSRTIPVQKSDMFRVLVIFAFGGVWADLDVEPLKNLEPLRDWSPCILSRVPDIQTYLIDNSNRATIYATNYTYTVNAFFACRPAHSFMFYLLSRLVQNSPFWSRRPCSLSRTVACSGPRLMALADAFYLRSLSRTMRKLRPEFDVICPEADWFMPTYDTTYHEHIPRITERCKEPKTEIEVNLCAKFNDPRHRNEAKNFSYTVHRWFHSYNFGKETEYYHGSLRSIVDYQSYDDKGLFEIVDGYEY